jgi:hypothetical protein
LVVLSIDVVTKNTCILLLGCKMNTKTQTIDFAGISKNMRGIFQEIRLMSGIIANYVIRRRIPSDHLFSPFLSVKTIL